MIAILLGKLRMDSMTDFELRLVAPDIMMSQVSS